MSRTGGRKTVLGIGRPPLLQRAKKSLPSKVTRTIIRDHHVLQKQLAQAIASGDKTKAKVIESEIEERGGLKRYQNASITGQSAERGGDSSKLLMQWLLPARLPKGGGVRLKMLEVGALSTTNACAMSGRFDMTWIDLNSQNPKIQQQDFMERPLSIFDEDLFDIISLSLVVNYVPDATGRGEMLRRTRDFMNTSNPKQPPLLFLVLPASCITNSRYMNEKHMNKIMSSLGFARVEQKLSPKLYYSLWTLSVESLGQDTPSPKVEVNPGRTRNNFSIVLN